MNSPHKLLTALVVCLLAMAAGRDGFEQWVLDTRLPLVLDETSLEVVDRNGKLLRAFPVENGRWRLATRPSSVDPAYLAALIGFEDKRFYDHHGVDPRAILRATGQAFLNAKPVSGASTITMQLARLLENGQTGRWQGKLRQMRVALALERRLSKQQILTLYLTHAPFGGNLEGVRAASYAYFGKEPTRLTPAQIALLVALPQAPETRRPDRFAQRAKEARNSVAKRLHAAGAFSSEALEAAQAAKVPEKITPFPIMAFHSAEHAKTTQPAAHKIGLTLDATLQARLEGLVRNRLAQFEARASVALIVARHDTGEVLASIGSAGPQAGYGRNSYVDMTRAIRSPGSALKPLVYAVAFDLGLAHPETLIHDEPQRFGRYEPSNFDGAFRGELHVREALQQSRNIPVVALLAAIGPERFMQRLRRTGAQPEVQGGRAGLAVALGGLGISLRDLTGLYAGLAQGGKPVSLHETTPENPPSRQSFTSRSAAWQVGNILAAAPLPNAPLAHGIAYKTGTSYGYRDNWAIGYDGEHVVGVWVGRPDGTPMQSAFARDTAAPLMAQAFQYLKPAPVPLGPPPAETLTVTNVELPLPLQRFGAPAPVLHTAPEIVFPPDGVRLALSEGTPLVIKLRKGAAPFTVLANGRVQVVQSRSKLISLGALERGFFRLSVIDANGRSAQSSIEVR